MIAVKNLVVRYGAKLAVSDLSFDVERGKVTGFLGPNGAGKSSTLRVIVGFLGPTSGSVSVGGVELEKDSQKARSMIGYMPEVVPLYPEMRVIEYLSFRAELKCVARASRKKAVSDSIEKTNLAEVANVLIGHLSKGYKQRVGLADALVSNPPLLVLDEPTAGLDPNQIQDVRRLIRSLGTDHTVFWSTHILGEVEATCDNVIVIAKGKLMSAGTLDAVEKRRKSAGMTFVVRGDVQRALDELGALSTFSRVTCADSVGDVHRIRGLWGKRLDLGAIDAASEEAIAALARSGVALREASPIKGSLEQVFAELTLGTRAEGPANDGVFAP